MNTEYLNNFEGKDSLYIHNQLELGHKTLQDYKTCNQ